MPNLAKRTLRMAKIIGGNSKKDSIVYSISMRECFVIYVQSIIIGIYILFKNAVFYIRSYVDKKFGVSKKRIIRKFNVLSSITDKSSKNRINGTKNNLNRSITPGTHRSDLGEHKFIRIKQTRFHYVEKGEKNDRVVLLLHGFPDCFYGWRNQIDILSDQNHVIALDLKGFNNSDKPLTYCHYKPDRICYELKCFIDALQIKSFCIIGHDIGALLGWIFTLKYPDYVNKFISISTPHPNLFWNTAKGSKMTNFWFNMIQIPFLPEMELSKDNSFIHETYKHLIVNGSSNEINESKQSILMETYDYVFSQYEDYSGGLHYLRNLRLCRVDESCLIRCPCILIFGTNNSNFKLDSAIRSAEYCENPLIKIIDGAGYWPHQTHVDEMNKILLKYLVGEKKSTEEIESSSPSSSPLRKGLMSRVMDKMYSVGQQYVV
ncbi:unnamed protein product [Chironomus riparius]|uniref:AB hydrolase-1 domain-containing protein n=1 Tax=Chironomus riparius TaxID=315576 RepID=A0A9N9S4Q1_9DIPT|nr:unnamed protein product [Chironomus riparius]